jgi:4-amino-4-deoxy-L-arabinose transferase-like glycosyltransferase
MPLCAWAPYAVSWLTGGGVTPAVGRVVPFLSLVGAMLVVLLLGRRHGSARLGLLAAGVLPLSALMSSQAHQSRIDIVLGFAVTAAVATLFHATVSTTTTARRAAWFGLAGVALALGVAAKGPLALVLVAAAVGPALLVEGPWRAWLPGGLLALACALLLTAAWLLPYLGLLGPEESRRFVDVFLLGENLQKFEGEFGKVEPWWTYAVKLVPLFAPWIVPAAWRLAGVVRRPREATPLERLAASWVLFPVIALSLSSGKHVRYLIPILPALALLAAAGLEPWLDAALPPARRALRRTLAGLGGLTLAAGLAAPVALLAVTGHLPPLGAVCALAAAAAGALALARLRQDRPGEAVVAVYLAASACVGFAYGGVLALLRVARRDPYQRVADAVAALVPPGAPLSIVALDPGAPDLLEPNQLGLYLGRVLPEAPPGPFAPPGYALTRVPAPARPVLHVLDLEPDVGGPWFLVGP